MLVRVPGALSGSAGSSSVSRGSGAEWAGPARQRRPHPCLTPRLLAPGSSGPLPPQHLAAAPRPAPGAPANGGGAG